MVLLVQYNRTFHYRILVNCALCWVTATWVVVAEHTGIVAGKPGLSVYRSSRSLKKKEKRRTREVALCNCVGLRPKFDSCAPVACQREGIANLTSGGARSC